MDCHNCKRKGHKSKLCHFYPSRPGQGSLFSKKTVALSNVITSGWTDSINLSERLTIAHLNGRSLLPKIDEVRNILSQYRYDIFAISESWLHDCIHDSEIGIQGYNIYRWDRTNCRGGGVCVDVKDCYDSVFVLNWCLKMLRHYGAQWPTTKIHFAMSIIPSSISKWFIL